jgi:hypothetical protein
MPKDEDVPGPDGFDGAGAFVPAVFARNREEAERYRELLDDHDIPARIGSDDELSDEADPEQHKARKRGMTHGVAILVPEALLEEASEVIADREDFAEFDEEDEEDEEEEDEFALGDGLHEEDDGPFLDEDDEEDGFEPEDDEEDGFEPEDDLDDLDEKDDELF